MSGRIRIKYLVFFLGFFLIAVNLLIVYHKILIRDLKSDFSVEYRKLTRENYLLTGLVIKSINGIQLNTDLKDKHPENYLFVWRYFDDFCRPCIEQEIILLKENITSIGHDNIMVLASTDNPRDLKSFFNSHDLGNLEIIISPKNEVITSSNNQEYRPFYFVADSLGNATMIFEPDIELPELSEKYFKMVISRYFSSRW